jgi:6-phosphogluconate dehydrogenase
MEIGLVGLGKMGGNMRTRLRNAGHTVVGYDRNPDVSDVASLEEMVGKLGSDGQPRVVWVMVPAGDPTRETVKELGELLDEGDLVVDGGNSKWTDDRVNADLLARKGVGFVDCGVSGGVWGLENGYALMCGGPDEEVAKVQPAFDALKPEGEFGFVHAGRTPGAGHYAKMVHNGIEYAIMQAYAEGWELLERTDLVEDVPATFDSWRQGTVIRSWLLDLLSDAIAKDPHLDKIRGWAEDSGEGRWTVQEAIENAVPMPAISAALFARFVSRQDDSPAMKAIAAMRNEFGGHATRAEG